MADASIPVDLLNPGQVLACLGFVEVADRFLGEAEGAFDWADQGDVRFHLRARGDENPFHHVLDFLDRAEAVAEAVEGSANIDGWKLSWGPKPSTFPRDDGYAFPDPESPATLVCALVQGKRRIRINHWGDETRRDNVKFWAGSGGYPGAALARDALGLIQGKARDAMDDPFALGVPQSSSFRLDWRRDYIPLDAGFSLNAHGHIDTLGYPIVELLAAVGLTNARPIRHEKLSYSYGVAGRDRTSSFLWLSPPLLRAAVSLAPLPFPIRRFRMFLDWPGKENQARAITAVTEEF